MLYTESGNNLEWAAAIYDAVVNGLWMGLPDSLAGAGQGHEQFCQGSVCDKAGMLNYLGYEADPFPNEGEGHITGRVTSF